MALLVLIALRKQRGLQYLWIQSGTKSCREHFCATHYILHQQDLLWFQKDGATAHAAQISTQVFRTMFLGRLISHFRDITLSACSPDLAVPDYFHWGYVKCEVYETYPANITDLKQRILECIQEIPKEILHCVTTALPSRLQECTEWHGGHLLHTYSMVQSPSWAANWFAVSQEILRISRNPKVQYHTHKRPPPVPILGQPNPVHIHTSQISTEVLFTSCFMATCFDSIVTAIGMRAFLNLNVCVKASINLCIQKHNIEINGWNVSVSVSVSAIACVFLRYSFSFARPHAVTQ